MRKKKYLVWFTTPEGTLKMFSTGFEVERDAREMCALELRDQEADVGELFEIDLADNKKKRSLGPVRATLKEPSIANDP